MSGSETTSSPVRVGLIGAGPWATMLHAPVFAAGPETTLAAVWARRPDAAAELAGNHGATAVDTIEALCDASDVVAFCVPPAVQADLAPVVAGRGKALVLEKPVAADVAGASRVADAVGVAGVPSAMVLSWRYAAGVRSFLREAEAFGAYGGRGVFVTGSLVGGPFRTPWRLDDGALMDLGPHVIDLLDAALGPVVEVRAAGDTRRWVSVLLQHESGAVSEAAVSADVPHRGRSGVELYGPGGVLEVDCAAAVDADTFATLRSEVAEMVRSWTPHALDAGHGVRLQRILADARAQLTS